MSPPRAPLGIEVTDKAGKRSLLQQILKLKHYTNLPPPFELGFLATPASTFPLGREFQARLEHLLSAVRHSAIRAGFT